MRVFLVRILGIMLPVFVMILLIPLIKEDIAVIAIYIAISAGALILSKDKKELIFFSFGLILLTCTEMWFVATGVETFHRDLFFINIPIWLPLLWAYSFVMMRRAIIALDTFLAR
ncbi:hypothetical protein C4568_00835 [Candidatus Parcubacteria bacterium]|nr:MAG: hypothetical protein C4568_00835 [Candidatus Parcubacteria bacterium]